MTLFGLFTVFWLKFGVKQMAMQNHGRVSELFTDRTLRSKQSPFGPFGPGATLMTRYAYDPYFVPRATNGLGIAGFIISLAGLMTGGILSPIGLILSLVALGRRPRGFAIAGVVLGAVGSCGVIVAIVAILVLGLATVAAGFGLALMSNPEKAEISLEMVHIAKAVAEYKQQNHYVPASLNLLHLPENIQKDPWGNEYHYEVLSEGKSFDIISAGADKKFDTGDDVRFSRLDKFFSGPMIHINRGEHGQGSGTVDIHFGEGHGVTVGGDENGGTVTVEAGGRTIQITGDQNGGSITNETQPTPGTTPATQPRDG
jgi:hypothetical protein